MTSTVTQRPYLYMAVCCAIAVAVSMLFVRIEGLDAFGWPILGLVLYCILVGSASKQVATHAIAFTSAAFTFVVVFTYINTHYLVSIVAGQKFPTAFSLFEFQGSIRAIITLLVGLVFAAVLRIRAKPHRIGQTGVEVTLSGTYGMTTAMVTCVLSGIGEVLVGVICAFVFAMLAAARFKGD